MGASMCSARFFRSGWLILLAAAGCASVIGADDYKVAPAAGGGSAGTGGTGGASGKGGTGGTAGKGGTGGTGGYAGVGGTGGRGGTGGTGGYAGVGGTGGRGGTGGTGGVAAGGTGGVGAAGGVGGTGGAGGTVTACTAVVSPNTSVVRACVLWLGCNPLYPDVTLSGCITYNTPGAFPSNACVASATACTGTTGIQSCIGAGYTSTECSGRTDGVYCIANKAVHCDSTMTTGGWFLDCTKRGGTCQTYVDPDTSTPTAACLVKPSCTESSGSLWCTTGTASTTDDPIYECVNGVGFGRYCSNFGDECFDTGLGAGCYHSSGTYCVPPSDPMGVGTTPTNPACSTATATACADNYRTMSFNCATSGLGCTVGATAAYCLAPGCTTAQADACQESCDTTSATVTVCVGGASYKINCKSYGFNTCGSYTSSTLGNFVSCDF